jgi:ferredoxin
MEQYAIDQKGLQDLFNVLAQKGRTLITPVLRNNKVVFGQSDQFSNIADGFIQTVNSPKEVVFPRTEKLFIFEKKAKSVTLQDFSPDSIPEAVIWGLRPCDAAALSSLDAVFNWDCKDEIFNMRMKKTTVITNSCKVSDHDCFCTSVNGGPGNTLNSDLQLTETDKTGFFIAEVFTEKGRILVDLIPTAFQELPDDVEKRRYLANVPVKFDIDQIPDRLAAKFESEIWRDQSLRCLGCGACAYVCPSCSCFDMQDESHGGCGERLRCWDSCGFSMFTMHTSGHNPREHQYQRWRQRVMHKFSYMPERLSVSGCTGCGRCSRACPAGISILENIISTTKTQL